MIQRIRKGWRTLRENKRAGVSLIVALCAVALIIGLLAPARQSEPQGRA